MIEEVTEKEATPCTEVQVTITATETVAATTKSSDSTVVVSDSSTPRSSSSSNSTSSKPVVATVPAAAIIAGGAIPGEAIPATTAASSPSPTTSAESTPTIATLPVPTTSPTASPPSTTSTSSSSRRTGLFSTASNFNNYKSLLASTTSKLQSVSSTINSAATAATAAAAAATTTTSSSSSSSNTNANFENITKNTLSSISSTVQKTSTQLATNLPTLSSSVANLSSSIQTNLSQTASIATQKIQHLEQQLSSNTQTSDNTNNNNNNNNNNSSNNMDNYLPNLQIPSFLRRTYTVPDKAVASQVLMYRQILHTQCKPNLRLSRSYEGTEAQRKVKHMPWWEHGVESTRKMVISYNNLIVRLWLNGAIMPFVDGGYASDHVNVSLPKDDDDDDDDKKKKEEQDQGHDKSFQESSSSSSSLSSSIQQQQQQQQPNHKQQHINTLINSSGLPPIPHPYWIDRLGFQQSDPLTDFRSGGVLSLAMLVHIVETCPNVHARFLPSGDTHMLPFGITCINVTDMIAKFCMLSKSVESMDALLSQKAWWRMFSDPDCLLVLQEVSMEILCNVVVEMGRERKIKSLEKSIHDLNNSNCVNDKNDNNNHNSNDVGSGHFEGQDDTDKVTVFDFAEILARTEKRVENDLLGAGPKSVDELRAIHSRNFTKYIKAIERKEQHVQRLYDRAMHHTNTTISSVSGIDSGDTNNGGVSKRSPEEEFMSNVEEAKKATMIMTENMIESAGGVFNKFKSFGFRSPTNDIHDKNASTTYTEEVDFAMPKNPKQSEQHSTDDIDNVEKDSNNNDKHTSKDLFDLSDAPSPPVIEKKVEDISVDDLFNFDDDTGVTTTPNFTIDDDDEFADFLS